MSALTATPIAAQAGATAARPTHRSARAAAVAPATARLASGSRSAFLSGGIVAGRAQASARARAPVGVVRAAQTTDASAKPKAAASGDVLDCVVVGGGVSGLSTGMALTTKHKDLFEKVLVTEGRERVGGNITTVSDDKYLWEEGPNSFQPGDPILRMAVDAGCADELVLGDPTAPRFVYWKNKLQPTPSGPPSLVTFSLVSPWGKIRAGLGAAGIMNGVMPKEEESVEQFVRRNLGAEIFERLIEPFCSGVYAGNPANLSMKAAFGKIYRLEENGGSIIGGTLKFLKDKKANPPPPRDADLPEKPPGQTVGSFRKGLKTLPEAIEKKLGDRVKVNWKLESLVKEASGLFTLTYSTPEGPKVLTSRTVVLTTPSYVAADLVRDIAPDAGAKLDEFYYPPVAAVTVSMPESALKKDRLDEAGKLPGFGQLHPRSQGVTTLGTIYSSSLFPGRCPEGEVLLLNYIGGATNLKIMDMTDEEIRAQVDKDLRLMLVEPSADPIKLVGIRKWPRAIPQFNVGHGDTLDAAKAGLAKAGMEGLFLGGNYVAGVALGRCVEGAYESAVDVAAYRSKVKA